MAVSSPLSAAWLRVLEREFADSLSPEEVSRIFKLHFDQAIGLLHTVDGPSRRDRHAALESLIAFVGHDSPGLGDVVVAAVRRGVRASADLQSLEPETSSVERRAVMSILAFEEEFNALGGR